MTIDLERLAKLLGMTGSSHDGEVLNAARLASRMLREAGRTWAQILNGGGSDHGHVEALRGRVVSAEAALRRSEDKNAALKTKLQRLKAQFERQADPAHAAVEPGCCEAITSMGRRCDKPVGRMRGGRGVCVRHADPRMLCIPIASELPLIIAKTALTQGLSGAQLVAAALPLFLRPGSDAAATRRKVEAALFGGRRERQASYCCAICEAGGMCAPRLDGLLKGLFEIDTARRVARPKREMERHEVEFLSSIIHQFYVGGRTEFSAKQHAWLWRLGKHYGVGGQA